MPIPSIVWLAVMVVLFVIEALTVGLTSIWFGVGALCALLVSFCIQSIPAQIAVFLAASILCLLAVRPLARKYMLPTRVATNADRVLGAEGIVTQTIDNLNAQGQIRVNGTVWTARSDSAEPVPSGTPVRVLRIEGVKVIVTPVHASTSTM